MISSGISNSNQNARSLTIQHFTALCHKREDQKHVQNQLVPQAAHDLCRCNRSYTGIQHNNPIYVATKAFSQKSKKRVRCYILHLDL